MIWPWNQIWNRFNYTTLSFGRYVTSIGGVSEDEATSQYWILYKVKDEPRSIPPPDTAVDRGLQAYVLPFVCLLYLREIILEDSYLICRYRWNPSRGRWYFCILAHTIWRVRTKEVRSLGRWNKTHRRGL